MRSVSSRVLAPAALLLLGGAQLFAQFSGAIYTSLGDGSAVNENVGYPDKPSVYLNGGPQNANSAGLPNGWYYYQVTTPNGTLLSTDNAACRVLQVVNGVIFGTGKEDPNFPGDAGCAHIDGLVNATNGSKPVQLVPFDDTTNPGGEYKVWLIIYGSAQISGSDPKVLIFPNSKAKTDNFKVKTPGLPQDVLFSGVKYYDANGNGVQDLNEVGIPDWTITIKQGGNLVASQQTDADGKFSFNVPMNSGIYEICEVQQPGYTQSQPVNNGCYSVSSAADDNGSSFGNYIAISGEKWEDANKDGVRDGSETPIAGIKILIGVCVDAACSNNPIPTAVYTDAQGQWSYILPSPAVYYKVCEQLPASVGGLSWFQSYPNPASGGCYVGTVGGEAPAQDELTFGNYCETYLTGGKTPGYWSNPNGKKDLTANNNALWNTWLNSATLNLRNASGAKVNPFGAYSNASYTTYRNWLLGGNAVYMGYMLSVQMVATQLTLAKGYISDVEVIFNGTPTKISDLISTANGLLADPQTCVSDRSTCEMYKDIFDAINNNKAVLSAGCPASVQPY